jgi:hypothetical protein
LPGFLSAGDESLGTFGFVGGTSGSAAYSLGLTSGFSADAHAGNVVSFRLFAADSSVSYLFDSRSFGTVPARPLLHRGRAGAWAALPFRNRCRSCGWSAAVQRRSRLKLLCKSQPLCTAVPSRNRAVAERLSPAE